MSGFLSYVAERYGAKSEDVASDVVAYLINESNLQDAIRNLLKQMGIAPPRPHFRARTRKRGEHGAPDIQLFSPNDHEAPFIFIENKFWSGLTSNQPCSYLRKLDPGGTVLFVVPEQRRDYIWSNIGDRCRKENGSFNVTAGRFCASTDGRFVMVITWHKLLKEFFDLSAPQESSDTRLFLYELRRLCGAEERKFMNLELSVENSKRNDLAGAVYDLMYLAEQLASRARDEQLFNYKRLSGECGVCFAGTRGEIGGYSAWIGFDSRLWSNPPREGWYGSNSLGWQEPPSSPLWIYFDDKEKMTEIRQSLLMSNKEFMFLDEGDQLAVPVWLEKAADVDLVLEQALKQMRKLNESLRAM